MALTQYCELDEVRAALGVNHVELPDAVLSLPVYEMGLTRELAKVSASLPAAFLLASEKSPELRTEQEEALVTSAHLFAVYALAKHVGVSLGTLAPKDVSDGKASTSRFSDSPYRDVLARVDAFFAGCRTDLAEAYAALQGAGALAAITPPSVFRRTPRNYDPVTGT